MTAKKRYSRKNKEMQLVFLVKIHLNLSPSQFNVHLYFSLSEFPWILIISVVLHHILTTIKSGKRSDRFFRLLHQKMFICSPWSDPLQNTLVFR